MALHYKPDSIHAIREKESSYTKDLLKIIPYGEDMPQGESGIAERCLYLCVKEVDKDGKPTAIEFCDCHGNVYPATTQAVLDALHSAANAAATAQSTADAALANTGTQWEDISSQYKVTCSNSSINITSMIVHRRGNTYHMKMGFSSKAKIPAGTKITFTITGGQLPLWNYHDACYSDETIGVGILSPDGTITTRVLATDWPSGYGLNYCYEYTV